MSYQTEEFDDLTDGYFDSLRTSEVVADYVGWYSSLTSVLFYTANTPVTLPDLPVSFARWRDSFQRAHMQNEGITEQPVLLDLQRLNKELQTQTNALVAKVNRGDPPLKVGLSTKR